MGQPNQEPSMEDILASIKRIIAEDSEAVGVRPQRLRREAMNAVSASPVLVRAADSEIETEQPAAASGELGPDAPVPEHAEAAEQALPDLQETDAQGTPDDVLELTSPMPETATRQTDPAPAAAEAPVAATAGPLGSRDSLLSTVAASASRNAFAALNQLQVRADEGKENTLEGLVADLLRPMLRDWLDRELPGIVERLVAEEIKRVSGRG